MKTIRFIFKLVAVLAVISVICCILFLIFIPVWEMNYEMRETRAGNTLIAGLISVGVFLVFQIINYLLSKMKKKPNSG